jgi:hypothetical protein
LNRFCLLWGCCFFNQKAIQVSATPARPLCCTAVAVVPTGPPFLLSTVPSWLPSAFRHWLRCSCVWVGLQPVCLEVPGTDLRHHPVVRAAATRFMSVPLGRSPPVLCAGVRWAKLAWRQGPSGRVGAARRKQPAVLRCWRRRGAGWGGRRGGEGGLTEFDPPGCYLFRRDVISRQPIFELRSPIFGVYRKERGGRPCIYTSTGPVYIIPSTASQTYAGGSAQSTGGDYTPARPRRREGGDGGRRDTRPHRTVNLLKKQ